MTMLIFLLLGLAPGVAFALPAGELSGVLLYGTGRYRAEVDGMEVQRAATQYEQVSLRYQNQGLLGDARMGNYKLMLGYEFNSIDPTITNRGVTDPVFKQVETGKVLYNAAIFVAPGGLPFRLSAYARDVHATSFNSGAAIGGGLPLGQQSSNIASPRLTTSVMTEISNGSHREIGATLLVGIRNGSYLGSYRDALSQLPRLLIDYREIEVDNTAQDFNGVHNRGRDLAFISLNKKDNWVHFRTHDFVDFLDSTNNTSTTQVMVGTVDQNLDRQWINLTNWIRISSDLSLTVDKTSVGYLPKTEEYRLNLLATAQREKTQAAVLSSFVRTQGGGDLAQSASVPIYFNYTANRDSYYRGSFVNYLSRASQLEGGLFGSSGLLRSSRNTTFDLGAELFRSRPITFNSNIQLEQYENDDSKGFAEKLYLEWANREMREGNRKSLRWIARLTTTATQTTNGSSSSRYLENGFSGSVEKNLGNRVRVGLQASVRRGEGNSGDSSIVVEDLELDTVDTPFTKETTSRFLSYSALTFIEHAGQRYNNRLDFSVETMNTDGDTISAMFVEHVLLQRRNDGDFTLRSSLNLGDSVSTRLSNYEYVTALNDNIGLDLGWASDAEYKYVPDRSMTFALKGSASGSQGGKSNNVTWLCSEKLDYRFFTINGIVRKLAEISEELGWERVGENIGDRDSAIFLRLSGSVYPTKYFYSKIISEFVTFGPSGSQQLKLAGETGFSFEKVQIALGYGRGYKAREGGLGEVKEERWDLKVRKTF